MRWLITGAGGMLAHAVQDRLAAGAAPGDVVVGLDRAALDITGARAVRGAVAEHRPDVVVNCAAYTAVDAAEAAEDEAHLVNAEGPRHLAVACAERGVRLVHVSTDHVFPGERRSPYPEDHPAAPLSAYGRTKLAGERAVLTTLPDTSAVARTAWLYGANGRNFVATMIGLEARRDTVAVVDDQRGQPTWAADVAGRLVALARRPAATGVFHATNSGEATWYDLAREVFTLIGADPARVRRTTTAAHGGAAPRPAYTVLSHARWETLGLAPPRDWRTALRAAIGSVRAQT